MRQVSGASPFTRLTKERHKTVLAKQPICNGTKISHYFYGQKTQINKEGKDERRPLGGEGKREEGKTIEAGEKGGEGAMSGRKLTPVAQMKAARERWRERVVQRVASGATDKTPWRWWGRVSDHAG